MQIPANMCANPEKCYTLYGHIEHHSAISSSFSLVVVQSVDGRSLTNFQGLPTKLPFGGSRDATKQTCINKRYICITKKNQSFGNVVRTIF